MWKTQPINHIRFTVRHKMDDVIPQGLRNHLFAICLFLAFLSNASAQFHNPFFVDTVSQEAISRIGCADFNGDGRIDILTSHLQWPYDHMNLYLQEEPFHFTSQVIPGADSLVNLECFAIGDINLDNKPDFILASENNYQITWFENTGNGFIPHLVDDSLDLTTLLLLTDFNGDSVPDILSLQHVEIVLYLASSPGTFGTGQVIHSGTEFYAIDTGDFNGDGTPDVSVASSGFDILLNDGDGHFSLHGSAGQPLCFGLQSADLDQDQDEDIAAFMALSGIQFFENDGTGQFIQRANLISSPDNFEQFILQDITCDSLIDLYTTIPQLGQVVLVENLDDSQFSAPQLIQTLPGELVDAMALADLNADGKPDAVWGNKTLGFNSNACTPVAVDYADRGEEAVVVYPNPSGPFCYMQNRSSRQQSITVYTAAGIPITHALQLPAGATESIELPRAGIFFVYIHDPMGVRPAIRKIIRTN